ncbi:hypothetical protein CTAYLR_000698 [Chrysophaeum taylorii]|uniref:Anoctamin transmembrane domain-containing protein n=1 Tax=Chrysophaeum taylorii TaxID=2483200 RepID=A0AAD7UAW5_9STRA|nr:hypothetical protein CTAYLR_000698 [Chrysophaeum taylorii]
MMWQEEEESSQYDGCVQCAVKSSAIGHGGGECEVTAVARELDGLGFETCVSRTSVLFRAPDELILDTAEGIAFRLELEPESVEELGRRGVPEARVAPFQIENVAEGSYSPYEALHGRFSREAPRELYKWVLPPARLKLVKVALGPVIKKAFPLHDRSRRASLFARATKWRIDDGVLDEARAYLGEEIAMYLAFLAHLAKWLVPFAAFGVCFLGVLCLDGYRFDVRSPVVGPTSLAFPVTAALWAVLMVEHWKRRQAVLAFRWGTFNSKHEDVERDAFDGESRASPVDGRPEKYFPAAKRRRRKMMSTVVMAVAVSTVVGGVVLVLALHSVLDQSNRWRFLVLSTACNAIQIETVGFFYRKVALRTTELENHRFETDFHDSLVKKFAFFHLINYNASLVYIAFVQPRVEKNVGDCDDACRLHALALMNAALFASKTATNFARDALQPYARAALRERLARVSDDRSLDPVADRPVFQDFDVLATRYAFATLFVTAMPALPLLVCLANRLEFVVDISKMLYGQRRPWPTSAATIGAWQNVFQAITCVAVLTNGGIVFFVMRWNMAPHARVWAYLVFQYVVFSLMLALEIAVDDVPDAVALQLKRQAFVCSKLIDRNPDTTTATLKQREVLAQAQIAGKLREIVDQPADNDARQRIVTFYQRHNPAKLWDVDRLIHDYEVQGKTETDLLIDIQKKYAQKTTGDDDQTRASDARVPPPSDLRAPSVNSRTSVHVPWATAFPEPFHSSPSSGISSLSSSAGGRSRYVN